MQIDNTWMLKVPHHQMTFYSWYENVLSDKMINGITELCVEDKKIKGDIVISQYDRKINNEIRDVDIFWLYINNTTEWLYRKCVDLVNLANEQYYNFDLTCIETLQYTEYKVNQFYTKHIDCFSKEDNDYPRKLSFSIQLSDPSEYEGGELILHTGKIEPEIAIKQKGSIIFFPSYLLHEVTPVTKGIRKSLVGWVRGPTWR